MVNPQSITYLELFCNSGFVFDSELQGLTGEDEECNGELLYTLSREQFHHRAT